MPRSTWRTHLADATFAALIAAGVMALAVRGAEVAGLNLGLAVLAGPAAAGALTAYLLPRIRALEVWLGQSGLGAIFAITVAIRDGISPGGVMVGWAMIAFLGLGAAAAVHASRPLRPPPAPLPGARVVHR